MTDRKHAADQDQLVALQELELTHGDPLVDLDRLVLLAADICSANLACFTVHDATTAYEVSSSFGARATMPKQECMCAVTLASNQTLRVPDAAADARLAATRYVTNAPFVRSFISVAVGVEPGMPIGALAIGHTEPGKFDARDLERLAKVSELVAAFLGQRRAALRATRAAKTTETERQRQHLFELIFNAIQEGVNVHSPRRGIVEMNPACLSIMGLTREDVLSRTRKDPRWRTFRPDGTFYGPDEFPAIVTLRSGKAFDNERLGIELPSGEKRWLSVNTVPLRHTETGEVEFAVVTMKDVTDQHLAEAELTSRNSQLAVALEQAEKASKAKTDFMGVMSHELRTPMNAIMGCALLISQSKLDPVQRRTLGVLEDAGKQMLAVLNDLLDLSALNADKVRIAVEPVSMLRLIEDAAVIWASDVRAKQLSLSVMIDPALSAARFADSARLLQIIGNLIANAIKFTSEGGITLRAWPERGRDQPNGVAIEVEDTGSGVPADAVERIFQPFEQIDVSAKRRHGGLGLGLPIARRLAQAMGGDIELESRPGQGSRFTVRIEAPIAAASPAR
ncbi:MAG: ATP-binding protein, partial [Hyphomonadaceae bacterium]